MEAWFHNHVHLELILGPCNLFIYQMFILSSQQCVGSVFSSSREQYGLNYCCCCLVTSVVSYSVRAYGLEPARLLCLWDSPGKNTGLGSHALLHGIFMTQGSNPGLPHCRQFLYCWTTKEAVLTANQLNKNWFQIWGMLKQFNLWY